MGEDRPGLSALLRNDDDPHDDPAGRRIGKDAVLRFLQAISRGDMAALADAVTDDIVYQMPFSESGSTAPGRFRRFVGRDEVVAFWGEMSGAGIRNIGPDEVELSILGDGSRIFVEQRGNMTMASGKAYRNRYVFRFDVRGGLVSEVREYINPIISAYAFERPIAGGILVERID